MRAVRRAVLILAAVSPVVLPGRPARGKELFAGLDDYVREAMKVWEVPGVALGVVKDGEVVLTRSYGVREVGTDRRVTEETLFPIASCTKSFTAALLAMLVDDGEVRWDDPVKLHLPELELADPYLTDHVTLRDLLSHRTGMREAELLLYQSEVDGRELLLRLRHLDSGAGFRERFIYNNAMYLVLGEVTAKVSGRSWEELVRDRILKPLGMRATVASAGRAPLEQLALRHWRAEGNVVARPRRDDRLLAAGGMCSTVIDMTRWLKLQLARGEYEGRRLISEPAVREMHALQFSIPVRIARRNDYTASFLGAGLGWIVLDYRGRKVVRHGGAWGAWVALIPEEELGVVVLSNLDWNGLSGMLMYDLLDAFLVGPERAWDRAKWSAWLEHEGPGHAYRPRDEARDRLALARVDGTKPSVPLERYAGAYESNLYGPAVVRHAEGSLQVTFGPFTTPLSHWHGDAFYVRSPLRSTFDWLLTFSVSGDGEVAQFTKKHVGWNEEERDHVFSRKS